MKSIYQLAREAEEKSLFEYLKKIRAVFQHWCEPQVSWRAGLAKLDVPKAPDTLR